MFYLLAPGSCSFIFTDSVLAGFSLSLADWTELALALCFLAELVGLVILTEVAPAGRTSARYIALLCNCPQHCVRGKSNVMLVTALHICVCANIV